MLFSRRMPEGDSWPLEHVLLCYVLPGSPVNREMAFAFAAGQVPALPLNTPLRPARSCCPRGSREMDLLCPEMGCREQKPWRHQGGWGPGDAGRHRDIGRHGDTGVMVTLKDMATLGDIVMWGNMVIMRDTVLQGCCVLQCHCASPTVFPSITVCPSAP